MNFIDPKMTQRKLTSALTGPLMYWILALNFFFWFFVLKRVFRKLEATQNITNAFSSHEGQARLFSLKANARLVILRIRPSARHVIITLRCRKVSILEKTDHIECDKCSNWKLNVRIFLAAHSMNQPIMHLNILEIISLGFLIFGLGYVSYMYQDTSQDR